MSNAANRQELPYELQDGSHVCYVEADPDDGMPAHYRPCPADLCQAAHLHDLLVEVREVEALIADLMEWAETEAVKFRAEGWAAHNRKESIKEATYIGREWAFMSMQFRIRELLDTLEGDSNVQA